MKVTATQSATVATVGQSTHAHAAAPAVAAEFLALLFLTQPVTSTPGVVGKETPPGEPTPGEDAQTEGSTVDAKGRPLLTSLGVPQLVALPIVPTIGMPPSSNLGRGAAALLPAVPPDQMAHAGAQAIRRTDAKVGPVEGDDDVGPVSAMAREHSVVRIDHVTTAAMAPPTPTTAIAHEASQALRLAGAGGLVLTEDAVQANARRDDDTARPGSQSPPNALRADTVDAASAPRAHATAPAKEEARADAPTSRSVAEQVAARLTPLRQGRQAVSLRLDPPELGSVRIEAVLDGHKLSVSITAERESSRSLLEGALGQLRDALTDRGLVTDQLTVHVGLDGSGGDLAHHQTPQPVLEDDSAISPVRAVARPQAAALAPSASDGLDLWA